MAAAVSLPVELFRDIVFQIEEDSVLITLLWVSSAFRVEAQRRIYRDISNEGYQKALSRLISTWLDYTTVIGRYIHRLDLDGIMKEGAEKAVNGNIATAYESMINLKELRLPTISDGSLIPPPGVTFQLVRFETRLSLEDHEPDPIRDQVFRFLGSQQGIRELDLICEHFAPISPYILPNLVTLWTKPSLASRLLPGRSIRHLYLYVSHSGEQTGTVNATTLRSLSLDDFHSLNLYESCFSTLEFLELDTVSPIPFLMESSLMPCSTSLLSKFSNLSLLSFRTFECFGWRQERTNLIEIECISSNYSMSVRLCKRYSSHRGLIGRITEIAWTLGIEVNSNAEWRAGRATLGSFNIIQHLDKSLT